MSVSRNAPDQESTNTPGQEVSFWLRWQPRTPAVAAVVFLLYAVNYLYFFVDDEGIGFAYAQHLIRGQGLTYSIFEGPTEGYSNLLHVLVDAVLLSLVDSLGLPKISVFALGKAISLLAGAGLVFMVGTAMRLLLPTHWRGQIAGMSLLALSGPVAVWSCSSLETIPFAALATAFTLTVIFSPTRVTTAIVLGSLIILTRTDGFAYVGASLLAALMVRPAGGRWIVLTRTIPPIAGVFAVYTAWRWWYFGSVLSLPLQTKLLYKLLPQEGLTVNAPVASYLARFAGTYEWWLLIPLCAGWLVCASWERDRRPFALLLVSGLLTAYVSTVGDWMFGFRFFTTLFPLAALLTALTIAEITRRRQVLGTVAMLAVAGWSAMNAAQFVGLFRNADRLARWQSWWEAPSFDAARYFAPYYPLYRDLKDRIAPGTVTVNNQAGFLPFMLDLENVDDLGITSRFFASLPTADVTFTEVGRYHALTNRPPLRAGVRYLVHREPRYIISWRHLIANANGSRLPPELLGGLFRLAMESDFQVVYERIAPSPVFGPEDFVENLAHPARQLKSALDGSVLQPEEAKERLRFLASESADFQLSDPLTVEVHLDGSPVHEIWIDGLHAEKDVDVTLTLHGPAGQPVYRDRLRVTPGAPLRYHRELDHRPSGAVFTLTATPAIAEGGKLTINDVRVLGQSVELREHVEDEIFERPPTRSSRPVSSTPSDRRPRLSRSEADRPPAPAPAGRNYFLISSRFGGTVHSRVVLPARAPGS